MVIVLAAGMESVSFRVKVILPDVPETILTPMGLLAPLPGRAFKLLSRPLLWRSKSKALVVAGMVKWVGWKLRMIFPEGGIRVWVVN